MMLMRSSESTFAVHVDCDNLWIYETEFGLPPSKDQDLIYRQALPALMEIFARWQIRATFFVVGSELARESCIKFCRAALAAGHRIANHSFSHAVNFAKLDAAQKRQEIGAADQAIIEATGQKPLGFRAPGYHVDAGIIGALRAAGYRYDSSSLPGPAGMLMKAYMTLLGRGGNEKSFGPWTAIFARQQPYAIGNNGAHPLWEFPIATFPLLRLPIHSTFIYRFGHGYLSSALRFLKRVPGHHVYLLHAIDGLDHPAPEHFLRRVIPMQFTFTQRHDFLDALGSHLQGRVVLTEDMVGAV